MLENLKEAVNLQIFKMQAKLSLWRIKYWQEKAEHSYSEAQDEFAATQKDLAALPSLPAK